MNLARGDGEIDAMENLFAADEYAKAFDGKERRHTMQPVPKVTFTDPAGQKKVVEAESGQTLLAIATDHDIPMEHACGGNGFCTTCLCHVRGDVSAVNDREEAMGMEGEERLGCQVTVQGDAEVDLMG